MNGYEEKQFQEVMEAWLWAGSDQAELELRKRLKLIFPKPDWATPMASGSGERVVLKVIHGEKAAA